MAISGSFNVHHRLKARFSREFALIQAPPGQPMQNIARRASVSQVLFRPTRTLKYLPKSNETLEGTEAKLLKGRTIRAGFHARCLTPRRSRRRASRAREEEKRRARLQRERDARAGMQLPQRGERPVTFAPRLTLMYSIEDWRETEREGEREREREISNF